MPRSMGVKKGVCKLLLIFAFVCIFIWIHPAPTDDKWVQWEAICLVFVTNIMWDMIFYQASLISWEEKNFFGPLVIVIPYGIIIYLIYRGILVLFRANYDPIGLAIFTMVTNGWILNAKAFSSPALFPSSDYLAGEKTTAELMEDKKKCREAIHRLIRRKTTGLFRGVKEETTDFEAAITDACEKHLNGLYDGSKQQTVEKCASIILLLSAFATMEERSVAAGFGSTENCPSDRKLFEFAKKYLSLCYKKRYINVADCDAGDVLIAFWEEKIENAAVKGTM